MSFPISIFIMLTTGLIGGYINFLLPANIDVQKNKKLRNQKHCIVLGIGATILVPLFLEIAQSKVLDHVHLGFSLQKNYVIPDSTKNDSTIKNNPVKDIAVSRDSTKSPAVTEANLKQIAKGDEILTKIKDSLNNTGEEKPPLKNYFLFSAYCFLAAAAGVRFINNIIDSVLKDKQIANLKDANAEKDQAKEEAEAEKEEAERQKLEAEKQKEEAENTKLKWAMNSRASAEKVEQETQLTYGITASAFDLHELPEIKPATNLDDPQKGRFGGKAINNNRQLKAEVKKSDYPGFYNVKIWVESLDSAKPLADEVIFYIHDSFNPSVYPITVDEFTADGKAMDDEILAYGAFTVGAVADKGKTLLELDLAEQTEFPKIFRER